MAVFRSGPGLTRDRLVGLAGVDGAAAAWALTRRRQVARRTARLVREVAPWHDAEVGLWGAAERSRVAADRHDAFGQHLTGIALQLGAAGLAGASRPDQVPRHLAAARGLLADSRRELRAALLDLHAPAAGHSLTDDLRDLAGRCPRRAGRRSG